MKNYIRNILIFIVTFSLVFGLCIIPSYGLSDFSNQPLPYISSEQPNNTTGMLSVGTYNIVSGSRPAELYLGLFNSQSDCYAFLVENTIYVVSTENNSYVCFYSVELSDNYTYKNYSAFSANNILENFYYVSSSYSYSPNFDLPIFSSLQNGISAVQDYIDNPPGIETVYNAYFDIPCGNVAYIKTGNDNTLTLSCTMPEFSKLTGSTGTYWTNTMEIAYGVPSYPPAGTTFPLSYMSNIQWFRSTEGRDLLGRTKKALFLDTTQSSDNFIVIYNPTYRELTMSGQGDINPTIRVQCSALIDYHIYSLTGEYNSQGTISSYSIDEFSDPYIGTPTSDNENVQGTNSTGATPNIGGSGNEIGGNGGIIEYVQGIQNTLDNFANSFISLLKAPISHIQSLISSGTDYFNVIRGLYGWLPDEVQGTINSAMIVSISVGVIALLL